MSERQASEHAHDGDLASAPVHPVVDRHPIPAGPEMTFDSFSSEDHKPSSAGSYTQAGETRALAEGKIARRSPAPNLERSADE